MFRKYQKIVLGDREFCGVDLANWLVQQDKTDFFLRLKKNEYMELNEEFITLQELQIDPGMSFFYQGAQYGTKNVEKSCKDYRKRV